MTLVWAERTCKTMFLGVEYRTKLSPRLSPTSRRHGDKNLVDRSDFVRARAVAFDENRLPVSKDMDFFDKRIAGAAETIAIRTPLNTASDRIDK